MRKSILVVDDDLEITHIIQDILKSDYEVIIANDGLKAMECSKSSKIDLILMDLHLPIFSGFWFCDAFKRKPETRDIPIIVVSGLTSPEDVKKAYQVGADGFLKKPFRSHELLEAVQKAIVA